MRALRRCFGVDDDDDFNSQRYEQELDNEHGKIETRIQKTERKIENLKSLNRWNEAKLVIISINLLLYILGLESLNKQKEGIGQQRKIITFLNTKVEELKRHKKFEGEYKKLEKQITDNYDFTREKYEKIARDSEKLMEGLKRAGESLTFLENLICEKDGSHQTANQQQEKLNQQKEQSFFQYFEQIIFKFREQISNLETQQKSQKYEKETLDRLVEAQKKENEKLLNQNQQQIEGFYKNFLQKIENSTTKSNFAEELQIQKQLMQSENEKEKINYSKQLANDLTKLQESFRISQTDAQALKFQYQSEKDAHELLKQQFKEEKNFNQKITTDKEEQAKKIEELNNEMKSLLIKQQGSIDDLTKQINQLKNEHHDLLIQKQSEDNRFKNEIVKLNDKNQSLVKEKESLQRTLSEQRNLLQLQSDNYKELIIKQEDNLKELQLKTLLNQDYKEKQEELKKKLEEAKTEIYEKDIVSERQKSLIEQLKEDISKLNKAHSEKIKDVQLAVMKYQGSVINNQEQVEQNLTKMRKKCYEYETQLERANKKIQQINYDRISDLQNAKQIWGEYHNKQLQTQQFEEQISSYKMEILNKINIINQLNRQLNEQDNAISKISFCQND